MKKLFQVLIPTMVLLLSGMGQVHAFAKSTLHIQKPSLELNQNDNTAEINQWFPLQGESLEFEAIEIEEEEDETEGTKKYFETAYFYALAYASHLADYFSGKEETSPTSDERSHYALQKRYVLLEDFRI